MWKTGRRMAPTLMVLAVSLSLVSGAEGRYPQILRLLSLLRLPIFSLR